MLSCKQMPSPESRDTRKNGQFLGAQPLAQRPQLFRRLAATRWEACTDWGAGGAVDSEMPFVAPFPRGAGNPDPPIRPSEHTAFRLSSQPITVMKGANGFAADYRQFIPWQARRPGKRCKATPREPVPRRRRITPPPTILAWLSTTERASGRWIGCWARFRRYGVGLPLRVSQDRIPEEKTSAECSRSFSRFDAAEGLRTVRSREIPDFTGSEDPARAQVRQARLRVRQGPGTPGGGAAPLDVILWLATVRIESVTRAKSLRVLTWHAVSSTFRQGERVGLPAGHRLLQRAEPR
jgi:hypothetical protein